MAYRKSIAICVLAALLGVASLYIPSAPPVQHFLREKGVFPAVAKAFSSASVAAPTLAGLLSKLVYKNKQSQEAALDAGIVDSAILHLQETNTSNWKLRFKTAALVDLLNELARDNPKVKDAVLQKGGLTELVELIKAGPSDRLTSQAATALATFAADGDAKRKKGAASAGALEALLEYLEDGSVDGKPKVAVAQALANLAADSSYVQGELLASTAPDLLRRLLEKGPDHRITQPAVYATANLAAGNHAAQKALQKSGALNALVKLVETAVEGRASSASEPFHVEILEHVAELQRTDPAVRAALADVGGLEELLGLIEEGAGGIQQTEKASGKDKQLVAVVEDEDDEEEKHSMRRLVRDLQDELDTEEGLLPNISLSELPGSLPSIRRRPSGARVLTKPRLGSRQNLASQAAWALSVLVDNNAANQDAVREAGGVEALVALLESAEDAFVAKGALGAISSLVKSNAANKAAVREAQGVAGLVRLLASNPADKEVLAATARALKFMTTDRPVYEAVQRSSSRWLRVISRQGSLFLSGKVGAQVSPTAVSAAVASSLFGCLFAALLGAVKAGLRAGRRPVAQPVAKKTE